MLQKQRAPLARYYRGARTVHVERLQWFAPGDFLYFKPMYDFDEALARSTPGVKQVRFGQVFRMVLHRRYSVLELAEPFTPSALPQNIALAFASRLSSLGGKTPTRFVTYAIENADLSAKIAQKLRLPTSLVKPLVSAAVYFCYSRFDRIVFGTAAAEQNYRSLLGERRFTRSVPEHTLIWGLPTSRLREQSARDHRLVFLGAFDDRKGVLQLMQAWDAVHAAIPSATLTMLGKGSHLRAVTEWAGGRPEVSVHVDPSRDLISEELAAGKALFLLSQPIGLWKEQIGLPILEGLEVGLEIVASTETGISAWLQSNGHQVLDPGATTAQLIGAVSAALLSDRTPGQIVDALPRTDGRFEADSWLFRAEGANHL